MITSLTKYPFFILLLLTTLYSSCQHSLAGNNEFQDITVAELAEKKAAEDNIILLDVRTPQETAKGIIEGAREIDFRAADFQEQLAALDKDATYVVYCRSGGRSASTCNMMQEMGFKDISNLIGGYQRWQAEQ